MRFLRRKRPVLCRIDGCTYPKINDRYCLKHQRAKVNASRLLRSSNLLQTYGKLYERK